MSVELMNHYLEILAAYVYDNDKAVTYKWLSKELEVHVNVAKQVLWEFWQRHQDENNIESTVMLIGNLKLGGMRVEVVKQSNLDAAKDKFNNIISEHLYSIQKSIPDLESLFMNDKGDVRFSAIKCNESVERNDEELSILRWGSLFKNHPIPEQDNKLKSINKSENVQMFEMNEHNQTNKKSTDKKTIPISQKTGFNNLFAKIPNKEKDIIPSTSKFTCINKEISPKQNLSINSQNSSSKESKSVKKKEKNDIANFFGKSSDVTKDSNQEEQTDNSMKDNIEDNAKIQVTFIKDNDKPKKETRGIKRNRSKESKNTIKKRKRIIVNDDLTDSQSEDERMKSTESESEEEIEIENLDKKEKSPSPPYMMDNNGKARILKVVDQTYEEDGFLVTKKIHVYENCSENVTESREKEETMKKESEGVAKVQAKKKQTTLTSFFKKS